MRISAILRPGSSAGASKEQRRKLYAPNRERMKFTLMWANRDWCRSRGRENGRGGDCPGRVTPETFERTCDLVIERCFLPSNYRRKTTARLDSRARIA